KPYPQLDTHPHREPRPPIAVPIGCDKLLSQGCAVTSSDKDPIIGKLSFVTDGEKEYGDSVYVELGPKLQWIQIDLGNACEIHAICIWHRADLRAYRDVICQISNDPEFVEGVVTVFNNDHDNSAGFGVGKELEYIETRYGRPFAVNAVKGRYVRCYSRGSTSSELNHYTEVEVFGKPLETVQQADGSKPLPSVPVLKNNRANTKAYGSLPEPPSGKVWLKINYPELCDF
ncbi:MAG: hypothetical protein FWF12_10420, partial [Betaproteobacteria bacterium]|nr:hypothetical protein [Betaproteobacteria bacterium]